MRVVNSVRSGVNGFTSVQVTSTDCVPTTTAEAVACRSSMCSRWMSWQEEVPRRSEQPWSSTPGRQRGLMSRRTTSDHGMATPLPIDPRAKPARDGDGAGRHRHARRLEHREEGARPDAGGPADLRDDERVPVRRALFPPAHMSARGEYCAGKDPSLARIYAIPQRNHVGAPGAPRFR